MSQGSICPIYVLGGKCPGGNVQGVFRGVYVLGVSVRGVSGGVMS